MSEVIPLSYIRIWTRKNDCAVDIHLRTGDRYKIDGTGIYIYLPDGTWSQVNTRQVFPVIHFYPSLRVSDLAHSANQPAHLQVVAAESGRGGNRKASFDEIKRYVDQYFLLLGGLSSLERYLAVRSSEAGLVNVLQMRAALNGLRPQETLGTSLLRHNFCTWDKLLAACVDIERLPKRQSAKAATSLGLELSGEILVAFGKITRTQLEFALNCKRQGSKPLGEILIQMGACSQSDIKSCIQAQESLDTAVAKAADRLGGLLVQQRRISQEALQEALRAQSLGRQPLHAVLVHTGACGKAVFPSFQKEMGLKDDADMYDEEQFAGYLLKRGIINQKQLEEAQNLQNAGRQVLGELLVQLKRCLPEDIELALNLQRHYRRLRPQSKKEKLGDILISRRLADARAVDKAARAQAVGKEQLGTTLVNLGVCTRQDFADALELQLSWREELKGFDDRLGQELVKSGALDSAKLAQVLQEHGQSNAPLGQVLVEKNICQPEAVIGALLRRDERRRQAFERFIERMK
jgi:hypothetical protein